MSKIDSPSSNNSRTSSETSETQSVEENITISTGNESKSEIVRISKNSSNSASKKTKRMKDPSSDKNEKAKEKPPWRAVSVSTLPKPDKNALLKAKLLDASRRLRQGKSTVALQTDIIPTKLMKEVNLGTQVDLILHREAGNQTDGSYMKRKEGDDEMFLTYAVSTLTDAIQFKDCSTQTLLPKFPEDDFMQAYVAGDLKAMDAMNFTDAQRTLLVQIFNKNKQRKLNQLDKETTNTEKYLKTPTLNSWHFELDEIGEQPRSFQPYTISAHRPWQSFAPLSLNGLYNDSSANNRLDWNILLIAIDELIRESNNLVDCMEDLSNQKSQIEKAPNVLQNPVKFPSEYWLPIIEKQEKVLDDMEKQLKNKAKD